MTLDIHTSEYWRVASNLRKNHIKEHWKQHRFVNVFSLLVSCSCRLILSYLVFPATFMFVLFLVEANRWGLAEVMNQIIANEIAEPFTDKDTRPLIAGYHFSALFLFAFTWTKAWYSPAKREADAKMDLWHEERREERLLSEGIAS